MEEILILDAVGLINAFGGTGATGRLFGVVPSAVSNWRAVNAFPDRLHYRVNVVAEKRGLKLRSDFFDSPSNDSTPDTKVAV